MPNQRFFQTGPATRVIGGPFSAPEDLDYETPSVSFGADAAIDAKRRQLALAGFDAQIREAERAQEPDYMKIQRANLADHGTIETAPDFKRRSGAIDAANLMDPAHPMGRLRADDERAKMAQIHESNVRPAEINAGVQRDKIQSDFDLGVLGQDTEAATGRYRADAEAQATLEKALAAELIGGQFKSPAEREQALSGFMKALQDPALRRRLTAGAGR